MDDLFKLLPLLNILMAFGIFPLIKNIQTLNTNLEKLGVRLDYIEKDIKHNHELIEKRVTDIEDRLKELERKA